MVDQAVAHEHGLPTFLENHGNLLSHFNAELDGMTSKDKGNTFALFVQRLVPLSMTGRDLDAGVGRKGHLGRGNRSSLQEPRREQGAVYPVEVHYCGR